MSLTEIEAQLKHLTPNELRYLALRSWNAFLEREGDRDTFNVCDEDDPALLAALDEAIRFADSAASNSRTGADIRERISEWTTK